jgi:hypothetical protein
MTNVDDAFQRGIFGYTGRRRQGGRPSVSFEHGGGYESPVDLKNETRRTWKVKEGLGQLP